MATEKLNLSELKKMIISEAEKIMSLGDPLSVDMNKMTNPGNSTGDALVMTKGTGGFVKKSAAPDAAENIDDTEEPLEVDMNEMDGDQGHDEQIAAAVKVSAAGSTKKGASVEGMKNSNFESKDKNPSTASSTPFEERKEKVDMNSQDRADNSGAKTYVEPGAELHKGASTGQHAAKFSEKAQNERETAERIAQGIQLPENFKNKADLLNFINEEAKKLSDVLFEESGKKNQLNELALPPANWLEIAKPYFENAEISVIEQPNINFRPKADVGEKGPQVGYTFGLGDPKTKKHIIFYPYANAQEKKFQIRPNLMDEAQAMELAKKLAPSILKSVSDSLLKNPGDYTVGLGYRDKATAEEAQMALTYFAEALKQDPIKI